MNSENMRRYMRLVEDDGSSVLGYALKDASGRFVSYKSGVGDRYEKNLKQMFPTAEEAERANNERLQYLQDKLEVNKKRQDSSPTFAEQVSIIQKLIDTPVVVVAIMARPV